MTGWIVAIIEGLVLLALALGYRPMLTPMIDGSKLLVIHRGNTIRWTCTIPRWLCLPG